MRLWFVLAILTAGVIAAPVADKDAVRWGHPLDGLRLGISLQQPARHDVHPGEFIEIVIAAELEQATLIPANGLKPYIELHVVTPDRRQYIRDQAEIYRAYYKTEEDFVRVFRTAGEWKHSHELVRIEHLLRMSLMRGWVEAETKAPVELSLREPGDYRAWAVCRVVAGKDSPPEAWRGTIKSGTVVWRVSELPQEQLRAELTDQQSRMIDDWLNPQIVQFDHDRKLREQIGEEMRLAPNDALAMKMLQIAQSDTAHALDAALMLRERAGTTQLSWTPLDSPGIDGPYLKHFAEWLLDVAEQRLPAPRDNHGGRAYLGTEPVSLYLIYHPDDHGVRDRLVALAKKSCHVTPPDDARPINITEAWRILLQQQVLREGMTVEEAIEILGAPNRNTIDGVISVGWYVDTPRHVNPLLRAEIVADRIVRWTITRG